LATPTAVKGTRTGKGSGAATKAPAPATRKVTVPGPEDLEHAKDDALLQLKIGRGAQVYAVLASAALGLDGILLLFFYPHLPTLTGADRGTVALQQTFFLLLPVLAGLGVAGIGLATKWEAYQLWPWEAHFSITVAAVAANAAIAIVYGLRVAGVGALAHVGLMPWFYPVELAGISLAFLGIVLTWNAWTLRQWASAAGAVIPVLTAVFVYFPPPNVSADSSALAVSLFLSAILYQTSGSFLHLISSGTRPHERELITSGQSRMFRLADEVRQKEDALHFREAALVKREADVENSLLSVNRQNDSLKEARLQLDDLEEDYRNRSDALVEKERKWAGQLAEIDAKARLVEDRTKTIEIREQEVQRLVPQVSAREQRLVDQEGKQTQRDVELTQRQQELKMREAGVAETEARLEARRKELDLKTADLLRREGDVSAKGPGAAASSTTPGAAQELAARELKLKQFKTVLDEQNVALGRRARETAERAKSAEESLQRSAQREAVLASREAALKQREAELSDLVKSADERRTQYDVAARDYQGRVQEFGKQQVESAQRGADLDRSLKSLADREATLASREKRLVASALAVDRREADLTARERALEATEAEVSLRRQSIERSTETPLALSSIGFAEQVDLPVASSSGRTAGARGRGIRDLSETPLGTQDHPGSETLAAPVGRRYADRYPTGTARLDDLLLGGIPPAGHIAVLGDAFVGKEVVLYSFLAEGLKRGEPAVLVTASRSPNEVSESLGVVLPQFREYEQMGMVRWIDASGSASSPEKNRVVVKGSDDRAGILSTLVQAANAAEGGRGQTFRVGFFGLSAVLAHGDERVGFSFLQNVVGILKPRKALAMYSLEAGALSDAQVETLLSRMDGAIIFRQDRDRTFLSAKGFGDVQTRDWVECRATQRSLIIGSFALERIR
jgi:KaiC/GvpD/RAD55 family RecA-like ATPase